uniref:Uncharacterized protein n=1 Tax=Physcomitrium patens TaxID=3218 RepID=A0A2K1KP10_PHYPA|nr:hypothetical protein PHYPA_006422 [Physcomitrium patens]
MIKAMIRKNLIIINTFGGIYFVFLFIYLFSEFGYLIVYIYKYDISICQV